MVKETPFLLPRRKDGFIDYKSIFQIVYTDLKQPYGTLDQLSIEEVSWMIQGNMENKKDHYEMISYAMKTAGVSIMSGKDVRLFDEEVEAEKKEIKSDRLSPRDKRERDLAYLEETFGEI